MKSESEIHSQPTQQVPSHGESLPATSKEAEREAKPKVVVIMGPSGSGKSKLAIDLASYFPIEIINADSMQVYHGLDVLTNKVPLHQQNGVPHHLLGTISPTVEFTAKHFRDSAIPLIDDLLSRNCLPVIVGGTNFYIQALVSPFLLDDAAENMNETESLVNEHVGDEQNDYDIEFGSNDFNKYNYLKELDPVAANRVHPHDDRKINQYLKLYARFGILPSKLYQGKVAENWGQIDTCRFDYCFICIDAAIPVLDHYVGERVDSMINAGLLPEVFDIYNPHAVYTRGLRQAIGVREFEDFLKVYLSESRADNISDSSNELESANNVKMVKDKMSKILFSANDNELKNLLAEAIDKVKLNTRRLVRRQKRRLSRLQTLFGWNIQHVDATESISSKSNEVWVAQVVEPAVEIVTSFLRHDSSTLRDSIVCNGVGKKLTERNLWTQYVCQACGNRVLRGAHEWEQHKQGRSHRKRISSIRKSKGANFSALANERGIKR